MKKRQEENGISSSSTITRTNNNEKKDDDDNYVWYFSYGSNMSYEVFVKRRGISSIKESRRCIVPGYTLSYEYDGFGYYEPSFATCIKQEDYYSGKKRPDIHGMAFLISKHDFDIMLATEGGNGWQQLIDGYSSCGGYRISEVDAIEYDDNGSENDDKRKTFKVLTLTNLPTDNRHTVSWKNCPSLRYKNLVVNGAKSSNLDANYIKWLEESQSSYDGNKIGKMLAFPFVVWCILYYRVGMNIFIQKLQMKRFPWIFAKIFYLYHTYILIRCIIPIIEKITGANGYYNNSNNNNNDDDDNDEKKPKKSQKKKDN